MRHAFILLILIVIGLVTINPALGQGFDEEACPDCEGSDVYAKENQNGITIWTDNSHYERGNIIKVFGTVENIRPGVEVGLVVISPPPFNNIVAIDAIAVDDDGTFATTLATTGESWEYDDGDYTIKVTYGHQEVNDRVIINLIEDCSNCPYSDESNKSDSKSFKILMNTDQSSYKNKDIISIAGKIESAYSGAIKLSIINPNNKIIWNESVDIKNNGDFSTLLIAGGTGWEKSGNYVLISEYGTAESKILFNFFNDNAVQKEKVPTWLKNNAKWWSQKQIGDSDFINGVKYLVEHEIISVTPIYGESQTTQESVPDWVRTNAEWWADGLISEDEFLSGIEYMIKVRIIKISTHYEQTNPEPTPKTTQQLSITTSQNSYQEGDRIVVSGRVTSMIGEIPVTVQIFYEGNLIDIAQMAVAQDGNYAHTFDANGPLWQEDGIYIVRGSYGTTTIETSFEFFTKPPGPETTDVFEVDAGSSGTFDVNYSILGGIVKNMVIDSEEFALVVILETDDDGFIKLELPRSGIDAKKTYNLDDTFIINIDGTEVPYREISTNADSRTIIIEFEEGDSDIKIIGTFVI